VAWDPDMLRTPAQRADRPPAPRAAMSHNIRGSCLRLLSRAPLGTRASRTATGPFFALPDLKKHNLQCARTCFCMRSSSVSFRVGGRPSGASKGLGRPLPEGPAATPPAPAARLRNTGDEPTTTPDDDDDAPLRLPLPSPAPFITGVPGGVPMVMGWSREEGASKRSTSPDGSVCGFKVPVASRAGGGAAGSAGAPGTGPPGRGAAGTSDAIVGARGGQDGRGGRRTGC
jgi:hypothetical protein